MDVFDIVFFAVVFTIIGFILGLQHARKQFNEAMNNTFAVRDRQQAEAAETEAINIASELVADQHTEASFQAAMERAKAFKAKGLDYAMLLTLALKLWPRITDKITKEYQKSL